MGGITGLEQIGTTLKETPDYEWYPRVIDTIHNVGTEWRGPLQGRICSETTCLYYVLWTTVKYAYEWAYVSRRGLSWFSGSRTRQR